MSSLGWSPQNSPRTGKVTLEAIKGELSSFAQGEMRKVFASLLSEQFRDCAKDCFHEEFVQFEARMQNFVQNELGRVPQDARAARGSCLPQSDACATRGSHQLAPTRSSTEWVTKRKINPALLEKGTSNSRSSIGRGSIRNLRASATIPEANENNAQSMEDAPAAPAAHPQNPSYVILGGNTPEHTLRDTSRSPCADGHLGGVDLPPSSRGHSEFDRHGASAMEDVSSTSSSTRRKSQSGGRRRRFLTQAQGRRNEAVASVAMLLEEEPTPAEDRLEGGRGPGQGSCLEQVVLSNVFEYVSCIVVLANAVSLGLQTEYLAGHWDEELPAAYRIVDHLFCFYFTLELAARIIVGGTDFFCGEAQMLNVFDMVLVFMQIVDEVVMFWHAQRATGIDLLRNFRIIRFLRILRLTRVLSFIGELRTLVVSIAASMKSLIWVIVLLLLLTYSFGLFLTHIVISKKASTHGELEGQEELDRFFGSVHRSMLSLFEAVSEGLHWAEVMDPLSEYISPWLTLIFLCYIVFALFALLNVVTGLFVEAAIATAAEDKNIMLMQHMCEMFLECDDDHSGTVSWEEFEEHLSKPEMETYLKELDIDSQEASMLFRLLDSDGSGEIEAAELVGGCLRLQGHAKALELAAFMHEFREFGKIWQNHAKLVEDSLLGQSQLVPMSEGMRFHSELHFNRQQS